MTQTNMYGVPRLDLDEPDSTPTKTGFFGDPLVERPEGYYDEQAQDLPPAFPKISTPRELLAPIDDRFIVTEPKSVPVTQQSPTSLLQRSSSTASVVEDVPVDISETLSTDVDMLQPRIDRVTPKIQNSFDNATFDPRSTENSDILEGRGAGAFGFTESRDEVLNLYEGIHGEGKVRVFEDTDAGIFEPSFYISLQKDDETFTPFSSPLQDTYDVTKAIAGNLAFEIPAGSAAAATAWGVAGTTAATVGLFGPPGAVLAPFAGAIAFTYTLYAMEGSGEKFKQEVLKDEMGLTDSEADEAESLVKRTYDAYNKGINPTEDFTSGERMAGGAGLLLGIPGALMDKFRMATGRLRRKYLGQAEEGMSIPGTYQSAVVAQEFAQKEGLAGFTLAQVKDNRIIERLDSLAQQTSTIIPARIREQMEGAVAYLRKHSDDVGEGNFTQFQDNVDAFTDYYASIKERIGTPDYEAAGTTIKEIDQIFRRIRYIKAQGLYNNVFDAIGDRSYNLAGIDDVVRRTTRAVIPEKTDGPVDYTQLGYGKGEANVFETIELLKTIGTSKNGELTSGRGLRAAVEKFNQSNPGYEIDLKSPDYNVDSPAKMLQMFATRFGEMNRDLSGIAEPTAAQKNAAKAAIGMRKALLDLIGNPNNADDALKAQIKKDLKTANDFYSETAKIVDDAEVKFKSTLVPKPDPAGFAKEILEKSRGEPKEKVLEALNRQREYIKDNLPTTNPAELDLLRQEFDQRIQIELANTIGGGAAEGQSQTALKDFLGNFSKTEREKLGYPPERVAEVYKEANMLAEMASDNWATLAMKNAAPSTPLMSVIKNAFGPGDTNTALNKLIAVAQKDTAGTGMENLRRGLFDYIVSTESGVLKEITQNAPTKRAGTPGNPNFEIDAVALAELLTDMRQSAPELARIFTPRDIEVLDGLSAYVNTISRGQADAGAALSGAQIIGELFTVDGTKFLSGLARLGMQKKISNLFTNDFFVNQSIGLGQDITAGNFKDTIKTYFFGKGALGTIIGRMAYDPPTEDEQMEKLFDAESTEIAPVRGMYTN